MLRGERSNTHDRARHAAPSLAGRMLLALALCAGCTSAAGNDAGEAGAASDGAMDAVAAGDARADALDTSAGDQGAGPADGSARGDATGGWALTVYYTAVEGFHSGAPRAVRGCLVQDCAGGSADLGTYPDDFVQRVMDEGTGRITSGAHAGRFLNWSIDVGYWLDDAPRDARGMALVPFVAVAADPSVAFDTNVRVLACGVDDAAGSPIDATTCARLRDARWVVRDRFTVGAVGAHLDLYIGEEDRADFENQSPLVISARDATIELGP